MRTYNVHAISWAEVVTHSKGNQSALVACVAAETYAAK